MKIFYAIFLIIIVAAVFSLVRNYSQKNLVVFDGQNNQTDFSDQIEISGNSSSENDGHNFKPPMERSEERIAKKPFGIFVSPQNSPVQPERFQGYHTGTDFEIFPEEIDKEIKIKAVCSGKLLVKNYSKGYGGVAVEFCELNGNQITVIYGHLKLESIKLKINDNIKVGDVIGILGSNRSKETDGERKHLHLGFHKGSSIDLRGYVNSKSQLSDWIDPCSLDKSEKICYN